MARPITFLVDVMTGIPSIVAGLFAYALFVLIFGPGVRMGIGGSVALSLLMIPIVVRSCEEMLKLVPDELREASYALGVPKWRTIVKVVLPTALAGIITGVTLAIARVIGETAPLLIIAGVDRLGEHQPVRRADDDPAGLHLLLLHAAGRPPRVRPGRAWGAALVLIVIVMALNLLARLARPALRPQDRPLTRERKRNTMAKSIDVSDLDIYYGDFLAVEGVSMTIPARSVTALIGPSGCGKSTFLRSLNRMHEVIPGARVEGKIVIDGQDLYGTEVDPVEVRRQVGMVFQRPNPFPTMSIYENVLAGSAAEHQEDCKKPRPTTSSRSRCAARTSGPRSRTGSTSPAWASPVASSSGSASPARSPSSRRCC